MAAINQILAKTQATQGCKDNIFLPAVHKLAQQQLQKMPDWTNWLHAKAQQHKQYKWQNMLGQPIKRPHNAAIFKWVWVYRIKLDDNCKKVCGACDSSTRGKLAFVSSHAYASTPEMLEL